MHFKLIIALTEDDKTDKVLAAAREAGATGATVINHARGEGLEVKKTFLGLSLEAQRDVLLFLVEERLSRHILETISAVGEFDTTPGTGIAFQINVEDAVGVKHQMETLLDTTKEL
ncbi:MAG: P-II family nitrogen regulator [Gammaproteobacteria bacterium]|jgi:nitrogen regulatory protein PII